MTLWWNPLTFTMQAGNWENASRSRQKDSCCCPGADPPRKLLDFAQELSSFEPLGQFALPDFCL